MTLEQFNKKLEAIQVKIPAIVQASLEGGVFELYTEMDARIFPLTNAGKTITGSGFGSYKSEAYKELRKANNLQVSKKDLTARKNLKHSMGVNLKKRAVVVDDIFIESLPYKRKTNSKRGKRALL